MNSEEMHFWFVFAFQHAMIPEPLSYIVEKKHKHFNITNQENNLN